MNVPYDAAKQGILIILPESATKAAQTSPLFKGMLPVTTGFFPEAKNHFIQRKKPLDEAILIYCQSGRGWIQIHDGKREYVEPHHFAIIPPGVPHTYSADEHSPWSIHWTHVRGDEVEAFIDLLNISANSHVLPLGPGQFDPSPFQLIHDTLAADYTVGSLLSASVQIRLIVSQLHNIQTKQNNARGDDPIEKSIRWMREQLHARIELPEFARKAGLSIAQYSAAFRKKTGYPPVEFYLRLKVQHACRLLDSTTLRIGEIANDLGYEDAFYFSRLFSRIMGKSPRAYRNAIKG